MLYRSHRPCRCRRPSNAGLHGTAGPSGLGDVTFGPGLSFLFPPRVRAAPNLIRRLMVRRLRWLVVLVALCLVTGVAPASGEEPPAGEPAEAGSV